MKKKLVISIIIILTLIFIAGGVFAYLYFGTNTFRSNKELFAKYILQNSEAFEAFNLAELKNYAEKQKNMPYSSEGIIKTNVTSTDSRNQDSIAALQNCSLKFTGNVDNVKKNISYNINANYTDSQSISVKYIQKNDIYALKIDDVMNKYLGFENNNLKDFAKKLGMNDTAITNIPNKIDLANLTSYSFVSSNLFTDEEIKNLKDKYFGIISEELTNDMFSKEQANSEDIYVLSLTNEKIRDIIKKIMLTAKDDQIILNKIKEIMINKAGLTQDEANKKITEMQSEIEEEMNNSESLSQNTSSFYQTFIKVYSQNNRLTKTEIVVKSNSIVMSYNENSINVEYIRDEKKGYVVLQKTVSVDNVKYNLKGIYEGNEKFNLSIEFNGINTDQITEKSELSVEIESSKLTNTYTNTKKFGSNIIANEVPNNEIMLLNTAPSVQSIVSYIQQVGTRFVELNNRKMEAARLNNSSKNPFMYYLPSIIPLGITSSMSSVNNALPIVLSLSGSISFVMLSSDYGILNRAEEARKLSEESEKAEINSLNNTEIKTFNAIFESYAGVNRSATELRVLYSTVISSNANRERKIKINGELPATIPEIDNTKKYEIRLIYDSEGFVNEINYKY